MTENLLEIDDLNVSFKTFAGTVRAVRGVSLHLKKRETLALVGESGSGKSVICRSIMGLLAKNAVIDSGEIRFHGEDLLAKSSRELQRIRGKKISMIFQNPMTSLNPTLTIGYQLAEPLLLHEKLGKAAARQKAAELLELVGIPDGRNRLNDYPHQFSGGQRQRIVTAIALACNPEILIADEPTTALDVTIQAQILALFKDIQKQADTSIIFITHDLGVVANVADRVAVVYGGKIVETGLAEEIFYHPQHPYTWGLLRSMPALDTEDEELYAIPGSPPNLLDPPPGDAFAARNPYALTADVHAEPPMFQISPTHFAATWLLDPRAPRAAVPDAIAARHRYYRSRKQGSAQNAE
ncbi:ATP-binding cassette domain-containing protein [Paenibacillus macerans]|uniref:ATP-binding cassette domain-containing protein n=3 Tax=Paenibacillus macerans TaxID=44252 RepID=A0A6N8F4R2_PAEMA|nr:ABC transporter ATP-binding protein [Paenibacillus macerans]MUG25442.1 ATP-binding cassette domain-containing protein [Paenibacillus macerans]UMV50639.1 ABC transporter ATP-binding protein [Paenibacillus macerans]